MLKSSKIFCKHTLSENDKNKIKRKCKRLRKRIKLHLNVEYKFISKNNLKENAD